jgi:hypothetical protein
MVLALFKKETAMGLNPAKPSSPIPIIDNHFCIIREVNIYFVCFVVKLCFELDKSILSCREESKNGKDEARKFRERIKMTSLQEKGSKALCPQYW